MRYRKKADGGRTGNARNDMVQRIRENNVRAFVQRKLAQPPPVPMDERQDFQGYADGGEVDDSAYVRPRSPFGAISTPDTRAQSPYGQELTQYAPTRRESATDWMMGSDPSNARKTFFHGLMGGPDGSGGKSFGLVDATPLGIAYRMEEAGRKRDPQGVVSEAVPGGVAKGMFVGPFGAHMLRQADRGLTRPHPVYAKSPAMEENAKRLRPEFQDIYKQNQVDMRDAYGRYALETRPAVGKTDDADVWKKTGWSLTTDNKPTKEITDTGTKLVKDKDGNWIVDHPQGDFHKIYELPPIKNEPPKTPGADAAYSPKNVEATISPLAKQKTSAALHEFQHRIQQAEGFPSTAPKGKAASDNLPTAKEMIEALAKNENITPEYVMSRLSPQDVIRRYMYLRRAGEQQTFNVERRRQQSYRYQSHPQESESIPRDRQMIGYDDPWPWPRKAAGGSVNPGLGASIGMSRQANAGLLRSDIPGRTDKLPINVPAGSYVIPADTVSALGQGNTEAGNSILGKMFNKGPYGMNLPKRSRGVSTRMNRRSSLSAKFADGGETPDIPVIAAGGEFVVTPDQVAQMGAGDHDAGFKVLDRFVTEVRKSTIKELRALKPPRKD